jgi:DNA excision repair protein ERCC-4
MKLPASLKPEKVVAICDTREQQPWVLAPLRTIGGTLDTGDYSIQGLEHVVRVERKSLPDLVACIGRERERFDREVQRLLAYPVRLLIVEATWSQIEGHEPANPQWRGPITSTQVIGSLLSWTARGLPIHMAGDHHRAGVHCARVLYSVAKHRYQELRQLVSSHTVEVSPSEKFKVRIVDEKGN